MTKIEQLKQFIKENKLEFTVGRRNSDLVVLCGYGLFLEADSDTEVWRAIPEDVATTELLAEFDRVWEYAEKYNYGKWWEIEANRKMYKL